MYPFWCDKITDLISARRHTRYTGVRLLSIISTDKMLFAINTRMSLIKILKSLPCPVIRDLFYLKRENKKRSRLILFIITRVPVLAGHGYILYTRVSAYSNLVISIPVFFFRSSDIGIHTSVLPTARDK